MNETIDAASAEVVRAQDRLAKALETTFGSFSISASITFQVDQSRAHASQIEYIQRI